MESLSNLLPASVATISCGKEIKWTSRALNRAKQDLRFLWSRVAEVTPSDPRKGTSPQDLSSMLVTSFSSSSLSFSSWERAALCRRRRDLTLETLMKQANQIDPLSLLTLSHWEWQPEVRGSHTPIVAGTSLVFEGSATDFETSPGAISVRKQVTDVGKFSQYFTPSMMARSVSTANYVIEFNPENGCQISAAAICLSSC